MTDLDLDEFKQGNRYLLDILRKALAEGNTAEQIIQQAAKYVTQDLTPEETAGAWIAALLELLQQQVNHADQRAIIAALDAEQTRLASEDERLRDQLAEAKHCLRLTGDSRDQAEGERDQGDRGTGPGAITGYCPMGCGSTLFAGNGGYITCSYIGCPRPSAVATLLDDQETEHIVEFGQTNFTVRHPLRERLDDALMSCHLHQFIEELDGPPVKPGRYRAHTGKANHQP